MKKEYRALKYTSYIKKIIILWIIPWIVPMVALLVKEEHESFEWKFILWAIMFALLASVIMCISRNVFLGYLNAHELDFYTVYELDKRNEKYEMHNLHLLINLYFYTGEFKKAIECSDRIMNLNLKSINISMARHIKILSLFFEGDRETVFLLIQQQYAMKKNAIKGDEGNSYYEFIEKYLSEEYEEAIQIIKNVLNQKNIEFLNSKKVLAFYLMFMVYEKIGDISQMQECADAILLADKNRRTFFSKKLDLKYGNLSGKLMTEQV